MNTKYFYLIIASFILLSSCYTSKPDSLGVSSLDYNKRVEVKQPHYKRVITPTGYGVMAVTIAGGAYLGMQSKAIQSQKGINRVDNKPINALLGGVVSLGINLLLNKSFKVKQQLAMPNFTNWVYNANKKYQPLESNDNITFRAIEKVIENSYNVQTLQDVKDFKTAFPNSSATKYILTKASEILNRKELIEVVKIYNNNEITSVVKLVIFKKSVSVDEVFTAKKTYGDMGINIEKLSLAKISNLEDLNLFSSNYNNTIYKKEAFLNSLKNVNSSDLLSLKNYYDNYTLIPISEINTLTEKQIQNYIKLRFEDELGNNYDINNYLKLAKKLISLSYKSKQNDLLTIFWNNNVNFSTASGNEIINNVTKYGNKLIEIDDKINLTQEDIDGMIKIKLDEVIKSSVSISNQLLKKVTSEEDWNHWQSNFLSNKIFQNQKSADNVAAIYSSVISNNSRFDLPVKLIIKSHLYSKVSVGGAIGTVGNILSVLSNGKSMNEIMNEGMQGLNDHGISESQYYDVIRANSTSDVLMPIRSTVPFNTLGLSLAGLYSAKYEIIAKDLFDTVLIADKNIDMSILNKQTEWATNIINGKYNAKLKGVISGEDYDINVENEKMNEFFKSLETATAEGKYKVNSKSENAEIFVALLPNQSVGNISLSTKNYKNIDKDFYSIIYSKNNPTLKREFKNLLNDGAFNYFKANDFPLIVSVNYTLFDDKNLNATIELIEPSAYEIEIKKR